MTRSLEIKNNSNQSGEFFEFLIDGKERIMAPGESFFYHQQANMDDGFSVIQVRAVRGMPEASLNRLRMALTPEALSRLAETGDLDNIVRGLAGLALVHRAASEVTVNEEGDDDDDDDEDAPAE